MTRRHPIRRCPLFPGAIRKNDALFMYGALSPQPFVLCYEQQRLEVVHGPACRPEEEIFLDSCAHDGINVVQRRGGGGTVVLSPGMVITIVVGQRRLQDSIRDHFDRIHQALIPLIDPENRLGIEHRGISDLAVDGRKILGSSLYLTQTPFHFYYQSSLMVCSDLTLLPRYLRHPPREPEYRKGRDHHSFCTTLKKQGCLLTTSQIVDIVNKELGSRLVGTDNSGI